MTLDKKAVMQDIFDLFGDKKRIEQTMRTASTDLDLAEKLEDQISKWEKEISQISKDEEKLIEAVLDNTLPKDSIRKKMDEFSIRKESIKGDIQIAGRKLEQIATEKELKSRSEQIKRRIERSFLTSDNRLKEMSFDEKRELLQSLFNGKDSEGRRYGVYLEKRKSHWIYKIKGNFQEIVGSFKLDICGQDQEAVK